MVDQILINNERDRRTLEWLRSTKGDQVISDAIANLAGTRKPYLSNILKILNVVVPREVTLTDRETAKKHLAELHTLLKGKVVSK